MLVETASLILMFDGQCYREKAYGRTSLHQQMVWSYIKSTITTGILIPSGQGNIEKLQRKHTSLQFIQVFNNLSLRIAVLNIYSKNLYNSVL